MLAKRVTSEYEYCMGMFCTFVSVPRLLLLLFGRPQLCAKSESNHKINFSALFTVVKLFVSLFSFLCPNLGLATNLMEVRTPGDVSYFQGLWITKFSGNS